MDFIARPERARKTINGWVSDRTEDKIKDLLPKGSIDSDTRLVLTNAIYFLGSWLHAFDKADTRGAPCHLLDGSEVKVPTMFQTETFARCRREGYQAIELPYEGEELSMLLLLPDEGGSTNSTAGSARSSSPTPSVA